MGSSHSTSLIAAASGINPNKNESTGYKVKVTCNHKNCSNSLCFLSKTCAYSQSEDINSSTAADGDGEGGEQAEPIERIPQLRVPSRSVSREISRSPFAILRTMSSASSSLQPSARETPRHSRTPALSKALASDAAAKNAPSPTKPSKTISIGDERPEAERCVTPPQQQRQSIRILGFANSPGIEGETSPLATPMRSSKRRLERYSITHTESGHDALAAVVEDVEAEQLAEMLHL